MGAPLTTWLLPPVFHSATDPSIWLTELRQISSCPTARLPVPTLRTSVLWPWSLTTANRCRAAHNEGGTMTFISVPSKFGMKYPMPMLQRPDAHTSGSAIFQISGRFLPCSGPQRGGTTPQCSENGFGVVSSNVVGMAMWNCDPASPRATSCSGDSRKYRFRLYVINSTSEWVSPKF